jgi:hypothetical protein
MRRRMNKFSYVGSTFGDSKTSGEASSSLQVALIDEEKQCKQRSARHQDFEHQIGPSPFTDRLTTSQLLMIVCIRGSRWPQATTTCQAFDTSRMGHLEIDRPLWLPPVPLSLSFLTSCSALGRVHEGAHDPAYERQNKEQHRECDRPRRTPGAHPRPDQSRLKPEALCCGYARDNARHEYREDQRCEKGAVARGKFHFRKSDASARRDDYATGAGRLQLQSLRAPHQADNRA